MMLRNWLSVLIAIPCCIVAAHGQTQLEMNETAARDFDAADKKLNATYQQVIKRNQANTAFIGKLRAAEKTWINYRDAYLKSIFPNTGAYGSADTMCHLIWEGTITNARTEQLKEFLAANKTSPAAESYYKQEDNSLNETYQKVLRIYPQQNLKVLRDAELAWISFRDADGEAFASLAAASDFANYRLSKLADRTRQRKKELQQWVDGIEEGDICIGCIPVRDTASAKPAPTKIQPNQAQPTAHSIEKLPAADRNQTVSAPTANASLSEQKSSKFGYKDYWLGMSLADFEKVPVQAPGRLVKTKDAATNIIYCRIEGTPLSIANCGWSPTFYFLPTSSGNQLVGIEGNCQRLDVPKIASALKVKYGEATDGTWHTQEFGNGLFVPAGFYIWQFSSQGVILKHSPGSFDIASDSCSKDSEEKSIFISASGTLMNNNFEPAYKHRDPMSPAI